MARLFILMTLMVFPQILFGQGRSLPTEYKFQANGVIPVGRNLNFEAGAFNKPTFHEKVCDPNSVNLLGLDDVEKVFSSVTVCQTSNPMRPDDINEYCSCMQKEYSKERKEERAAFVKMQYILSSANGVKPKIVKAYPDRVRDYLNKSLVEVKYESDRSSLELQEKFKKLMHGKENVGDSYSFLNMGLIMDGKKTGLNKNAQNSIAANLCSIEEAKKGMAETVAKEFMGTFAMNPAGGVSILSKVAEKFDSIDVKENLTLTPINRLAGSCFTAEEFTEFRSFPDTNVLKTLAESSNEKVLALLNADMLLKNDVDASYRTIQKELTEEEKSFKKFLQGNPLLAVFFLSTKPTDEKEKLKWEKNRADAINELKSMATKSQSLKSPQERLKLFRDFNSNMKDFLGSDSVQEDIATSQALQCKRLQEVYTVSVIDDRPTIYDLETFDKQDRYAEFCKPGHPLYELTKASCIERSSYRCYVHENSERLKKESMKETPLQRDLTRADKGIYHLTKTLSEDISAQAYELESKLCGQLNTRISSNCDKMHAELTTYQACLESSKEESSVKIQNRKLIKNEILAYNNPDYVEGNILRELMIENLDKPYVEKWSHNDVIWDGKKQKSRNDTSERTKQAILNDSGYARTSQEDVYIKKIQKLDTEYKQSNAVVSKIATSTKGSFENKYNAPVKVAATPPLSPTVKEEIDKVEKSVEKAMSQNQPIDLPSILPAQYNNYSRDEKKAVVSAIENVVSSKVSDKPEATGDALTEKSASKVAGSDVDGTQMKALREENADLQNQLISGLRSQLDEMKAQIASLKEGTNRQGESTVKEVAKSEVQFHGSGFIAGASSTGGNVSFIQPVNLNNQQQSTGGYEQPAPSILPKTSSAQQKQIELNNALKNRSPASIGGLEVVNGSTEMTFSGKPVVFDESMQKKMVHEELKLNPENFKEVSSNQMKLKSFLVGMKLGEESIIIVREQLDAKSTSHDVRSLHYYVKKDAKGGITISPVNRAKLEDLKRNILSVQNTL